MKTIIIEDEKAAVNNLQVLLADVAPQCTLIGVTSSIVESVKWLQSNPMPDLIFMDIHLADGSAFEIFEYIEITCPIIFTTAYDEYALKAFKVNGIDYLLKPIGEKDMKRAIDKLNLLTDRKRDETYALSELIKSVKEDKVYKNYFLIPSKGSKLVPLSTEFIACFIIENGVVKVITKKNVSYIMPHTLDELMECLNPHSFFRANRQSIIAKDAILDIDYWFNGRLSVNLIVAVNEKVIITKARVSEFKEWFG
ncbi:MAG: LytR/AlgR family response regulator transcription factor [Phocaeicola sp.]